MKNTMAPGIPLAIVLFAAVATVALRAASRRQEPRWLPGTEPEPVTADESRPRPPPSAVEQMQDVFHELHPDGRNALCAVCDGQLARRTRVGTRLLRALVRQHFPGLAVAARADPAGTLESGAEGERAAVADLAGDRVQGGVGGGEQVGRVR